MKKIYHIFLLASILCNTILPIESALTPQNTEIIFDIDEVLIEKMGYGIYEARILFGGIWQNPKNTFNYIEALFNLGKSYIKDEYNNRRLYDNNGNQINGLTFHFLYLGMHDPQLTPYVAFLVETIENSRWYIPGTIKICRYLKYNKGYTVNFATNKDRILYDLTAQAFGHEFTAIPTKVFVAQPGNDKNFLNQIKEFADLTTTPLSYKELAYKALNAQPTNKIFHAPGSKPGLAYYQYMEKIVGPDKNMIFIDDQKVNIDGFNTLQETTAKLRYGIQFKNPIQLADELIQRGVLSATKDTQLLNAIGYPPLMRMYKYPKSAIA